MMNQGKGKFKITGKFCVVFPGLASPSPWQWMSWFYSGSSLHFQEKPTDSRGNKADLFANYCVHLF